MILLRYQTVDADQNGGVVWRLHLDGKETPCAGGTRRQPRVKAGGGLALNPHELMRCAAVLTERPLAEVIAEGVTVLYADGSVAYGPVAA